MQIYSKPRFFLNIANQVIVTYPPIDKNCLLYELRTFLLEHVA